MQQFYLVLVHCDGKLLMRTHLDFHEKKYLTFMAWAEWNSLYFINWVMGHRPDCGLILPHEHNKYWWERKILAELEKPTVAFLASDKLIILGDFISHAGN